MLVGCRYLVDVSRHLGSSNDDRDASEHIDNNHRSDNDLDINDLDINDLDINDLDIDYRGDHDID